MILLMDTFLTFQRYLYQPHCPSLENNSLSLNMILEEANESSCVEKSDYITAVYNYNCNDIALHESYHSFP